MSASSSALRDIIESSARMYGNGKPLRDLTVLSPARDPYRLDTPAHHELGRWLADVYERMCGQSRLHLRGVHYRLVGQVTKPDGYLYINDDDHWIFLCKCVKAARFLGYLPWDALRDARNTPPEYYDEEPFKPARWRLVTDDIYLSLPEDLTPRLTLDGTLHRQPWQQVVIAEKQGVGDLLRPLCQARNVGLAMPTGELSDQMLRDIMAHAAIDGRPLVIHQLGDFDPAGWQMAVSTARTAQALRDTQFPSLDVRVHAIGLTREQCIDWILPSTPLKLTEKRADRWSAAMGREQTELDAAVALVPDRFRGMVQTAIDQYWDAGIASRARQLRRELTEEANARLAVKLGDSVEGIRSRIEDSLGEVSYLVDQINQELAFSPDEIGIDMPDVPPVMMGQWSATMPALLDTADDWAVSTQRMIERKAYGEEGGQ